MQRGRDNESCFQTISRRTTTWNRSPVEIVWTGAKERAQKNRVERWKNVVNRRFAFSPLSGARSSYPWNYLLVLKLPYRFSSSLAILLHCLFVGFGRFFCKLNSISQQRKHAGTKQNTYVKKWTIHICTMLEFAFVNYFLFI